MIAYIVRRLLLIIPTLLGIMIVNFAIIQFAPGGPVEQAIAEREGIAVRATARVSGGGGGDIAVAPGATPPQQQQMGQASRGSYRGSEGLSDAQFQRIVERYGFDRPPVERFFTMLWNYARFDFGNSIQSNRPIFALIWDKMDVSIALGLSMTLLSYGVSIPLGIRKAVKDGSRFDTWTSTAIIIGYAIPGFIFAVMLIILFAGGTFLQIFPMRGLTSSYFATLPWWQKPLDLLWHLALPVLALAVGAFATSTLLVKNSFVDEIRKQYVTTARAKGLTERRILYGHIFRNAMLLVISGFPSAFIGIFFAGSLLIETIFSLDGIGLLGFEAAINRDYPVMFATLYVFSLLGLVLHLVSDVIYMWVDPRIDFESRRV